MCYKESNQDQLDNFTEELRSEGKLTEETEVLMKQLEEAKPRTKENLSSDEPNYLVSITNEKDIIFVHFLNV